MVVRLKVKGHPRLQRVGSTISSCIHIPWAYLPARQGAPRFNPLNISIWKIAAEMMLHHTYIGAISLLFQTLVFSLSLQGKENSQRCILPSMPSHHANKRSKNIQGFRQQRNEVPPAISAVSWYSAAVQSQQQKAFRLWGGNLHTRLGSTFGWQFGWHLTYDHFGLALWGGALG